MYIHTGSSRQRSTRGLTTAAVYSVSVHLFLFSYYSRQKLGDRLVETYAGPGEGVQTIKASEWEPFIRIMPHSEFPSASSCLCQVRTIAQPHTLSSLLGGFTTT